MDPTGFADIISIVIMAGSLNYKPLKGCLVVPIRDHLMIN